MTLFRVRCFYCSATRDGDQTPELNVGGTGSGELGVTCEVPEGATGLKIWREVAGSPPSLLATLTDVTAQPHVLTFPPGENVSVFVTATNAGGEGEPSTTVSATAP